LATPYLDEMALESKNNEAIDEIITLRENVGTDEVPDIRPVNLTGRQFFAQARTAKSMESDLLCQIQVTIHGDPLDGKLRFYVSEEVMKDVPAIKGHYDVLTRVAEGASIDNLYQAPFVVSHGFTDPSQWT
jgi:hypothetical protein